MIQQNLPEIIGYTIFLVAVLFVVGVFAGLSYIKKQNKNKTLQWLAELAYSKAERAGQTYLSGENDVGSAKFREAVDMLTKWAAEYNIKVNPEILANSVQWAYQRMEGIPKMQGTTPKQIEESTKKAFNEVVQSEHK